MYAESLLFSFLACQINYKILNPNTELNAMVSDYIAMYEKLVCRDVNLAN